MATTRQDERAQANTMQIQDSVRERILSSARLLFLTHGFRSVTMDDLARELGMSKKTLYNHFSGKKALLEAVLLEKFQDIESELNSITVGNGSGFPTVLHQFLATVQHHIDEIQPPFVRDLQREIPEMFHLIEDRRRQVVQRYFGKLLAEGRLAGIIRDDIPTELIIEIFLGAVQAIMNPRRMGELGLTPKSGFTAIIHVILEGVITEQGRSKL